MATKKKRRCGGKLPTGKKCAQLAGWGTDHAGTGGCKHHDDIALQGIKDCKKKVVELIRQGEHTLDSAAIEVGYKAWTVWYWRQVDGEFDEAMSMAMADADELRVRMIDDNMFKRIMDNKAAPVTEIFYLKNKSKHWRDKHDHEVTGKEGKPLFSLEAIRSIMGEDT